MQPALTALGPSREDRDEGGCCCPDPRVAAATHVREAIGATQIRAWPPLPCRSARGRCPDPRVAAAAAQIQSRCPLWLTFCLAHASRSAHASLGSRIALARALLRHGALDVAVALVVEPPVTDLGFHAAIARAKATYLSVAFHVLRPSPASPPTGPSSDNEDHHMAVRLRHLYAMNAPLHDFLRTLAPSPAATGALVLDMFCGDALDVAAELDLPAFFFFLSDGTGLAAFLALSDIRTNLRNDFTEDLDDHASLTVPGTSPFRVPDLLAEMVGGDEATNAMFRMGARMPESCGVLINMYFSLDSRAVQALCEGLCVVHGPMPLVYCMGPLVSLGGGGRKEENQCLQWLDAQPDRTVVFLCFGSMGAFAEKQLHGIAIGPERSGQKFLCVVRSPHATGNLSGGELKDEDA
ncbi:hypothetical protein QOZ80_1AG0021910 [Eleusine coracana subsp. coracana]|nr:hypothetical protein QOZ80_1AG0021910 [Eleusine coracana subsp. coracana]